MSLYKLIILYYLQQVSYPLTTSQISDFVVTQNYMSWFRMKEVLDDLTENKLIEAVNDEHMTHYTITQQGLDLLTYLTDDLSSDIKEDVRLYLKEHSFEMRGAAFTSAKYNWVAGEGYVVRCKVSEGEKSLIDLVLTVEEESAAQTICDNWYRKNADVYAYLMNELL